MKLFDETENKYYQFISLLLQNGRKYSNSDISFLINKYFSGETDFDVTDTLFANDEGQELIFYMEDGNYVPIIKNDFPIRMGTVEKQAVKSLLDDEYIKHFLLEDTIAKLASNSRDIQSDWTTTNIELKNVFSDGVTDNSREHKPIIALLAKAIKEHRAIKYDNVRREKNIEFRDVAVFPVRIEFSIKNDRFRISAYEPCQHRFIKMNLDTMENIVLTDVICQEDLELEYKEFLKLNTKVVKLDVEPVDHVIERCFRIFSYYDCKARYDKEDNKYRLEISYLRFDESEIIKDILSLGEYVTVMEPCYLQKEVYRRVLAASKLYEN